MLVREGENKGTAMAYSIQPWAWVLETLAEVKEADTALLKALVTRAPGFSKDPCYKNAQEKIALRHLEERSDSMPIDTAATGNWAPSRGVNALKRSEDVLLRVLRRGATSSDRERHGMELSKHDVDQFVLQKRACLPKAALDQMKDLLLEGCHPSALYLKERSGLPKENQAQFLGNKRNFPDSSNGFEAEKRPKLSTDNAEFQSARQNSVAPNPENRNILPQDVPAGNSGQQAFQHNFSFGENRRIDIDGDHVTTNNGDNEVLPQNVPAGNSGQQAFQHNLFVGENRRIDIDGDHFTTNNGDNEAVKRSSTSLPSDNGDKMPREPSPECTVKTIQPNSQLNICVNEAAEADYHGVTREAAYSSDWLMVAKALGFLNSRDMMNHDSLTTQFSEQAFCVKCEEDGELLICSGSGCMLQVHESCLVSSAVFFDEGKFYCPFCSYIRAAAVYRKAKEKLRVARKSLSDFMGRDLTHNKQAPITRVHREPPEERIPGDLNCSNGGDFLTTRPGQLVENNHNVTITDAQQHVEIPKDCNKTQREPSEARMLGDLNCSPEINGADLITNRSGQLIKNHRCVEGADTHRCVEGANGGDFLTTGPGQLVENNQNVTVTDAQQQVEIPKDCNKTQKEPSEARMLGDLNCSPEINGGDLFTNTSGQLIKNHRCVEGADAQQQVEIPADHNSSDLACREAGQSFAKNTHDVSPSRGIRVKVDMLRRPDQCDPSPQPRVVADGGEEPSFSRQSAKRQRPSIRYKNPCYPYMRRTTLPWTREEEEVLKEAVGRFSRGGQIPWALILEYGSKGFHKTRTQIDLKDKWRNLQKKQGYVRLSKS